MSLLRHIKEGLTGRPDSVDFAVTPEVRLSGKGVRVAREGPPLELSMGDQRLWILPAGDAVDGTTMAGCLLFDPERYLNGIAQSLRITAGEHLILDSEADHQRQVFSNPKEVGGRRIELRHDGQSLVLREPTLGMEKWLTFGKETWLRSINDHRSLSALQARRHRALDRIVEIYGGRLEPLAPGVALDVLQRVNRLLEVEEQRLRDSSGNVGAVVQVPRERTPIVIGDLHGQVDNLLVILSENAFLDAIESDQAVLIFLGDAVHRDDNPLEEMDSSVLILDLILQMKLAYPSGVHFLLGNHESFSPNVTKGGVPQGILWGRHVSQRRGDTYRQALERFFGLSPLVALSDDFAACHAGPPRMAVSFEKLVDARRYPDLQDELLWTRQQTPGFPSGYTASDVRRFRRALGLDAHSALIVGHYPRDDDRSIWFGAGKIRGHHVVYSSRATEVGVMTRVNGELVPLVHEAEPLTRWVNNRVGHKSAKSGSLKDNPPRDPLKSLPNVDP